MSGIKYISDVERVFDVLVSELGKGQAKAAVASAMKRSAASAQKFGMKRAIEGSTIAPKLLKGSSGFKVKPASDWGLGYTLRTYGPEYPPEAYALETGKKDTTGANRAPIRVKTKRGGAFMELPEDKRRAFVWGGKVYARTGQKVTINGRRREGFRRVAGHEVDPDYGLNFASLLKGEASDETLEHALEVAERRLSHELEFRLERARKKAGGGR